METPPSLIGITVQEEFANHLCAEPKTSNYSRLSVFSSYFFKFEMIKRVPPEYFYPKPKVNSCIVKGVPVQSPEIVKENDFFPFLTALFSRKHRKARNNFNIYQKQLPRQNRREFQTLIDGFEGSSEQPINLTPVEILEFYKEFRLIIKERYSDVDFPTFQG